MWRIQWSQTALKELYGLERDVIERIVSKMEQAADDPTHHFTRLLGRDEYKLRIVDYRLIAFIVHETDTILVRNVRHRKDIYKEKSVGSVNISIASVSQALQDTSFR